MIYNSALLNEPPLAHDCAPYKKEVIHRALHQGPKYPWGSRGGAWKEAAFAKRENRCQWAGTEQLVRKGRGHRELLAQPHTHTKAPGETRGKHQYEHRTLSPQEEIWANCTQTPGCLWIKALKTAEIAWQRKQIPLFPGRRGGGVQHLWFASSPKPPLICILFVLLREGEEEQRRG